VCWLHGIGGIGGLGTVVHCGACGSSTGTGGGSGGDDWVIVMVGWVLGDGGSAGEGTRSKKLGGL